MKVLLDHLTLVLLSCIADFCVFIFYRWHCILKGHSKNKWPLVSSLFNVCSVHDADIVLSPASGSSGLPESSRLPVGGPFGAIAEGS